MLLLDTLTERLKIIFYLQFRDTQCFLQRILESDSTQFPSILETPSLGMVQRHTEDSTFDRNDQHRGGDQDLGVDGRQRGQGLPEGDLREEEARG